jgi:hypothetical protein
MNFRIVAYYTKDTPYETLVPIFEKPLLNMNVDYTIKGVPNRGEWVANTCIKPEFILEMLDTFPQNIVYIDIDAIVRKYPILFDTLDADIAVHYLHDKELLSGTIFLRNNEIVRKLLKMWILSVKSKLTWDQKALQRILDNLQDHNLSQLKVVKLPPQYTKIFDIMKDVQDPVIEHFQASRRFKRAL